MENIELTPAQITQRLIDLEARLRGLEAWSDAVEDVLSLAFLQMPGDQGLAALSRQANELDQPARSARPDETIQLLDRLRSLLYAARALSLGDHEQP